MEYGVPQKAAKVRFFLVNLKGSGVCSLRFALHRLLGSVKGCFGFASVDHKGPLCEPSAS